MACYDITVETHNSIYKFRYGKYTDQKPYTQNEKLIVAMNSGLF